MTHGHEVLRMMEGNSYASAEELVTAIVEKFGANIGTTVTGQIVALKLNDLALPAVTLGVLGLMVARKTASRGTLCTMLVQSSSATIGITIALAETGVIPLWTAIPIVLGDNIGTTITAALVDRRVRRAQQLSRTRQGRVGGRGGCGAVD